jgi:O-antigen/teichoic acid export membrane protein
MSVRRNTLYNLAGSLAPMAVSLVTIPIYLRTIGVARYGILSIVWLFIGYFAVFDLGLSRATSYHLARLADRPDEERSRVFWTALVLNTSFGIVGGLVLYPIAAVCFSHLFKMPSGLKAEVLASLPWLALSVPVATIGGALSGALDGRMRFAFSNGVNLLGTTIAQVIPLGAALLFGPELTHVIPAAIIARLVGMIPLFVGVILFVPAGWPRRANLGVIRELFNYGGWVSISNLITPLLGTLDKMLIGVVLGAADVAYYTIPDRLVQRGSVLPAAIVRALFPSMAATTAEHAQEQAKSALEVVSAALTLIVAAGILAMPLFFRLWINAEFAKVATPIGIVLALGIYVNGIAHVPSSLLQARGRVDLTAKFHMIEIVPHVIWLYLALHYFALLGAASAMFLVCALDAFLLCSASQLRIWRQRGFWISAAILTLCALSSLELSPENPRTYMIYGFDLLAAASYAVLSVPPLRRLLSLPASLRAKQTVQ